MAEQEASASEQEDAPAIGFRDLLRGVNLRDFLDMVLGELTLVLTSARLAIHARPLLMPFALALVFVRLFLLVGVVIVLGGSITLIMLLRGLSKVGGRKEEDVDEQ